VGLQSHVYFTKIVTPRMFKPPVLSVRAAFARARTYARTASHEHGPKIFLDYDQVELDAAYDQPTYAFNGRQVGQRQAANSEQMRQRLGEPTRVSYGSHEAEKVDVYRTQQRSSIQIFVHGVRGLGAPEEFRVSGRALPARGRHVAIPDFARVDKLAAA